MTTIEQMFNELIDDSRNGGDWETSMANIVIWANALQAENARLRAELEQAEPRCHNCGDPATIYDDDPYMRELYPEAQNDERWWCADCIQARRDDL